VWSPELWVCNTLRWRMLAPKYDDLRAEHAYATSAEVREAFPAWVRGGGNLLALHAAPICFDDWPGWGEVVGARWDWDRSGHPPLGGMEVQVVARHPVTEALLDSGVDRFTVTDEAYGRMWLADDVEPLTVSRWDGADHPLLWARRVGEGKVVTSTLGHGAASFDHPSHRCILRAAVAWLTGAGRAAAEQGDVDA